MTRFAILSHALPPTPSGQSVMLYRILSGVPAGDYYLVSHGEFSRNVDETWSLPVTYYFLPTVRCLHRLIKHIRGISREVISILFFLFFRTKNLVKVLRQDPVDVLVACSGNVADIPAGFFASRIVGIPFVAYIFDDYVYQWMGFNRSFAKMIASLAIGRCAGVVAPNEFIIDEYRRRYDVDCALVRNPGDADDFIRPVHSSWPMEEDVIRIVYTGAVYHANYGCFLNLIKALEVLDDSRLELHIYTSQTVEELDAQGIRGGKVYVHTHLPYDQVLDFQRRADILFLPLAFDSPINEVIRTSAPGKLAEYLASGRPLLAHTPPDSFVAYYLNKYSCGLISTKNDPSVLAADVLKLISNESTRRIIIRNARKRALQDFLPEDSRRMFIEFLASKKGINH